MLQIPRLFTFNDLKDVYKTSSEFSLFVFRAMKKGEIKQIKRGLYALVDPSTLNIYATKFQIACHLFKDSYFSYHEALEYYGLATQSFVSVFTYLTNSHGREFEFENVTYIPKKSPCDLSIIDHIKENDVRVVTLERAIVDSIDCISLAGGIEEVEYALVNTRKLDLQEIELLLKIYDKCFLYQKVGYLFEKCYGDSIPKSFYDMCLKRSGNKIQYFDAKVGHAKLVLKWKLMVPKERDMPDEIF